MINTIKTIRKTKIFAIKRAKGNKKHRANEHISGRNWRRHLQTNSENVEMPHSADIGNIPWSTTLLKQTD